MSMGQGDVVFDGLAEFFDREVGEGRDKSGDLGDAANVFVFNATFERRFALGIAGEESTVIFFEIGVAMPTGSEHEVDKGPGPQIDVVASCLRDLIVQDAGELEVNRVFSGLKILMIVDVLLSPVRSLVVEDLAPLVESSVGGAPENAAGVMFFWRLEGGEAGVVFVQRFSIIIPVDRHSEGVGDE